LKGILKV